MPLESIYFKTDSKIDIINQDAFSHQDTNQFPQEAVRTKHWHEICVHHHGDFNKNVILDALFHTIGNIKMYPVKYLSNEKIDRFFVRQCFDAIEILFRHKLYITTRCKRKISLSIKLNVANFQKGQIVPENKILDAIRGRYENLVVMNDVIDILDLGNLANSPELAEVDVNFGIKNIFDTLTEKLNKNHDIINNINGLDLSNNNLTTLSGMMELQGARLELIDLRINKISEIRQLNNLECIQELKHLYISGNPIDKQPETLDKIIKHFPTLLRLVVKILYNDKSQFDGRKLHELNSVDDITNIDACDVELNGKLISIQGLDELNIYKINEDWHQIKIQHNGNYSKNEIVSAFFEFFVYKSNTEPFYICYYKVDSSEDTFLVRNQYEHLKLLLLNNLVIPIKGNKSVKLKLLMLAANYKKQHITPEEFTKKAMSDGYNDLGQEKCLNLSNFISSSAFKKRLIFDMNLPNVYGKLLTQAARNFPFIKEVNLSSNMIKNTKGLKGLAALKNLRSLNLSDNLIENINDLKNIPSDLRITSLYLDGNPLCANYHLPQDYIKDVKDLFRSISKLDGVEILLENILNSRKNFVVNMEGFDITEQFLDHYFTLFESKSKSTLCEMYHKHAIFTISNYSKMLGRYQRMQTWSRNLLYQGANNIYQKSQIKIIFEQLPNFKYDFHSFTTDVHIYSKKLICITVTGIVKELPSTILESSLVYAFTRTFILTPIKTATEIGLFNSTTEYQILNDVFSLTDPTMLQMERNFQFDMPKRNYSTTATNETEKNLMKVIFQQMFNVKQMWASRCLDEAQYNFRKALEVFQKYIDENKIPESGFHNISN